MDKSDIPQVPIKGGGSGWPSTKPTSGARPHIYPIRSGWRAFIAGTGAVFVIFGLVFGWYLSTHSPAAGMVAVVLIIVFGLGMSVFGGYAIVSTLTSQLLLYDDAIEIRDFFRQRRLLFSEIAGRRVQSGGNGPPVTVLVPQDPRRKKIKFSRVFRTDAVFDTWLRGLPDLDQQEQQKSEAEIVADPAFGQTPAQRLTRLAVAKKIAAALHVAMVALYGWAFLAPRPYELVIGLLMALPWVAILLVAASRGLFRIDGRRNDAHPNLAAVALGPALVLALRAYFDVHLVAWTDIFVPAIIGGAVLSLAEWAVDREVRRRPLALLALVPFALIYAGACVTLGNTLLDRSPAEIMRTTVLDKHVESGKHTTWYLTLAPWGPFREATNVTVAKDFYAAVAPRQNVCVHLRAGAFKISWFLVGTCPSGPQTPPSTANLPDIAALQSKAALGDAAAQFALGRAYELGLGIPRDYSEAARWYRASADANPTSAAALGYLYELGRGVAPDFAKARRQYESAAQRGNLAAATNLARLYVLGRGGPVDYGLGFHWYMMAAKQGDPRGMNGVGYSYLQGFGVEKDGTKAVIWLRAAAEAGQPNAMHTLAMLLLAGEYAPRDPEGAYRWLLLAVRTYPLEDPTLRVARGALDQAAQQLSAEQRAAVEASVADWKPGPGRPPPNIDDPSP